MKNFSINHRQEGEYDILELNGELDAHTASRLENALTELIQSERNQIIVNFEDLEYIASAGLGVFMAYIEDVRNMGGDIKLSSMNSKVFNVFDLLGFPTLYDIVDDEHDAKERFKQDEQK